MVPVERASSCRGVSFEGRAPAEEAASNRNINKGRWVSFNDFLSSDYVNRSISLMSNHFCDLGDEAGNDNDDDDIEDGEDVEKQKPGREIEVKTIKKTNNSRLSIILFDQGLFTMYKRLFAVVFALNMTSLGLAIAGYLPYAKERAALLSITNILALTLCRSEAFLRIVFWVSVKLLGRPSVPLPIKLFTTSFLRSLGGIHSSCGVSSIGWLVYALVLTLGRLQDSTIEIVVIASTILFLLCLSCMAAFPLVRHLHHNFFERTHRFAGWGALALLWAFIVLTTCYDSEMKSYNNFVSPKPVKQLELWFTMAVTFFTLLPWVTVRCVPVSVIAPSGHASIIRFGGGVSAGILGRISRSPLSEWHAFGIISDGKDNHMMLAGAVGDFTKGLVSDPPSYLWVRCVRFAGLPYLVNMYERAVLVATGSGICVFLSFLLQPSAADVCVVWVAKGVEQNFGKEIEAILSTHPPGKVIVHDTAVSGRPNISKMTIGAAKKWNAEAIVVTSNPQGSKDVVGACQAAGIPAFGPIWDS